MIECYYLIHIFERKFFYTMSYENKDYKTTILLTSDCYIIKKIKSYFASLEKKKANVHKQQNLTAAFSERIFVKYVLRNKRKKINGR